MKTFCATLQHALRAIKAIDAPTGHAPSDSRIEEEIISALENNFGGTWDGLRPEVRGLMTLLFEARELPY